MEIRRIDSYADDRFSKRILFEHGAYLIDGDPYEVEIISPDEAIVRGKDQSLYRQLIEEFRFHAPQILRFYDDAKKPIAEYPTVSLFEIGLDKIQPSQFFIDEDKLAAVSSFIEKPEDIVIQVMPYEDRFISLDGHTRLYLAAMRGYASVKAVVSEVDDSIWSFVKEAERRKIFHPRDMTLLSHEEYTIQWDGYCDIVFENLAKGDEEKNEVHTWGI
jgi:hypothetical protein